MTVTSLCWECKKELKQEQGGHGNAHAILDGRGHLNKSGALVCEKCYERGLTNSK